MGSHAIIPSRRIRPAIAYRFPGSVERHLFYLWGSLFNMLLDGYVIDPSIPLRVLFVPQVRAYVVLSPNYNHCYVRTLTDLSLKKAPKSDQN